MSTKVKSPAWRDIDVKPLGIHLFDSRGRAGYFSYVAQVYEVTQISGAKSVTEFRQITRNGEAVYLHKHPELQTAFRVAAAVVPVLIAACNEADDRIPRRRP